VGLTAKPGGTAEEYINLSSQYSNRYIETKGFFIAQNAKDLADLNRMCNQE